MGCCEGNQINPAREMQLILDYVEHPDGLEWTARRRAQDVQDVIDMAYREKATHEHAEWERRVEALKGGWR